MSLTLFFCLSVIVMAAAFIQGAVGMGFALIVAPVMGFVAPGMVPVVLLVLMLPLNLYVTVREYKALDLKGGTWITAGRVLGGWFGVLITAAISAAALDVFIGVSTILAALLSLAAPSFIPGPKSYVSAGLITGITETATGIGGPPMALVYQHHPAATLRSTLALCFLVGEVLSLIMLAASDMVQTGLLVQAATLIPAVIIGAVFSRTMIRKVDGPLLQTGVILFAIVSGLAMLIKGFME